MAKYPERIICLTEESVETLYMLGEEARIIGVSAFVERPPEAKKIARVSGFTQANIEKIVSLRPDLVLGFSDIQKDIAKELIGLGVNVFIANHRSVDEILNYILLLGSMVGKKLEAQTIVSNFEKRIDQAKEFGTSLKVKPRFYLEEWDEPMICGIQWFSEVVELCGGINIFKEKSDQSLAKNRFVTHEEVIKKNPDYIFACWCGKKVDDSLIYNRAGYSDISAIAEKRVFELDPAIFLQPGPAPLVEGLDIIESYFKNFPN